MFNRKPEKDYPAQEPTTQIRNIEMRLFQVQYPDTKWYLLCEGNGHPIKSLDDIPGLIRDFVSKEAKALSELVMTNEPTR